MKLVRIAALAAVVLVAAALAGAGLPERAQGQAPEPAAGGITVTGTGSVSTVPDRAELAFGVVTQAATARAALTANGTASARVATALRAAGVAAADLQTQQLSLSPTYREGQERIVGYTAQTVVSATIRDLARVAVVLDAGVAAGANTVSGPSLARSDAAALYRDALEAAVADAREKAVVLAAAGRVSLGRVVSLVESGGGPVVTEAKARDESAPSIEPGTQQIEASVTVTFGAS